MKVGTDAVLLGSWAQPTKLAKPAKLANLLNLLNLLNSPLLSTLHSPLSTSWTSALGAV